MLLEGPGLCRMAAFMRQHVWKLLVFVMDVHSIILEWYVSAWYLNADFDLIKCNIWGGLYEDLKRYMNIIAVGGIRWSDANCYIFVHSCFGGVCVPFILYQCWLVIISRCTPSGMLCCVSGSVVPTISEALRSFFSTGKYWPTSTASHPRRLDCAATLLCEPQILCHSGLFVIDLLLHSEHQNMSWKEFQMSDCF